MDEDAFFKYLEYLDISKYSDNIKKQYGYYIRHLIGQCLDQDKIDSLCQYSHAFYRAFLNTVLRCFRLRDLEVPKIKGRVGTKDIVYYSREEMSIITKEITDYRLNLSIRLMYENGLRISEVLGLKKKDFDLVNKRVRGIGKGKKSFDMAIQPKTLKSLQDYLECFQDDEDYIFKKGSAVFQRQKLFNDITRAVKKVLPYKDPSLIFCHAFRHTTGTHLRESGYDLREIQTFLRHSQLETVAKYTAVDKRLLESKIGKTFS